MMLAAERVDVALGGRPVLCGVDAVVRPGELLGLIGANGAGKSTLLRTMAGLQRPAAGRVLLDGTPLRAVPPARLALARAFLPQSAAPSGALTVHELVALGRLPHRSTPAQDEAAIDQALADTGTAPFRTRPFDTLSGGERMRVLLARALAVQAPVLLADEPVAALDPAHQLRIMHLLHGLAAVGAAVAVVLHDLTLSARFCHRLVLLHRGAVLAEGPPDAVLTDAALAQAYGVAVRRHDGMLVPWEVLPDRAPGIDSGGQFAKGPGNP